MNADFGRQPRLLSGNTIIAVTNNIGDFAPYQKALSDAGGVVTATDSMAQGFDAVRGSFLPLQVVMINYRMRFEMIAPNAQAGSHARRGKGELEDYRREDNSYWFLDRVAKLMAENQNYAGLRIIVTAPISGGGRSADYLIDEISVMGQRAQPKIPGANFHYLLLGDTRLGGDSPITLPMTLHRILTR